MKWDRCSYLNEREYANSSSKIVNESKESYWEKIVGKEPLKTFFLANKIDKNMIWGNDIYGYNIKNIENISAMSERFFAEDIETEIIFLNNKRERLAFDNFYLPFVKFGTLLLREKSKYNTEVYESCYVKLLLERLMKASIGILMFEMQLNQKEGILKGWNSREEYLYYNDEMLTSKKYIKELMDIYPVLERVIFEIIDTHLQNFIDVIDREYNDRNDIIKNFEFSDYEIEKVVSSGSDSHNRGKSVLIFKLKNGESFVYKPRSLKTEKAYQNFCIKISSNCKYIMKEMKIIDKGDYGWEEFVKAESCSTEDELRRYYYRFGILVFINYILDANDLHVENLIAQGEYPVVIDAETILDNKKTFQDRNARMVVSDFVHDSVLYSGLLPHYRFARKGKAINMSAINGRQGEEYPILVPVIKDAGTSHMHYEYEHPVTQKNNNLACIRDQFIDPWNYMEEICMGFRDSYQFVMNHKHQMLAYINIFENLNVRHLIQDTQRYSMILHTSLNPFFMQNGRDRSLFLSILYKDFENIQGNKEIVSSEIEDILHLDIPYFTLNTSYTDLYGSSGKSIPGYFVKPSIERLREKIKVMNKQIMYDQERFIKISLTDLDKCEKDMSMRKFNLSSGKTNEDDKILWAAVKKIADVLIDSAFWGDRKKDVNWLGISSIGQRGHTAWNIQPLGNYFYDGIAGIAIFFRALDCCSDSKKYREICDAIEYNLFEYTDEMAEVEDLSNENSGIFSGESGIVYSYILLYHLTKKKKYLNYAEKHALILKKIILEDQEYDIIYGNAGAIVVILELYSITKNKRYIELASMAGERLIENQSSEKKEDFGGWIGAGSKRALSGFSHGAAGIIYALSLLWKYTGNDRLLNSIEQGLQFERSLYNSDVGNWIDRRERSEEELEKYSCFMTAWCHGAAGILLGRCKTYELLPSVYRKRIKPEIISAVKTVISTGFNTNDCLCHGNIGNTEIIIEYAKIFHEEELLKKFRKIRVEIAKDICKDSYDAGRAYLYGYKIPGFMTGIAGIGYSLLRDINEDLPSVLSVEI